MKNMKFFLQLVIFILLLANVDAATISHPASEVTAGTFDTGDFTFPNNLYVTSSVRPSILYDRDNTGYYLDPASTSRINYGVFDNAYSYGWMQAPIFYDANNNAYYVDPTGTSVFNTITLGGVSRSSWPSGDVSGSGSSNYIAKFTGSNTLVNSIIYDNGNIGIGTTGPATKLNVDCTPYNTECIRASYSSNAHSGGLGVEAFSTYWGLGVFQDGTMVANFENGGMAIGPGYVGSNAPSNGLMVQGNVGIGTTSPSQKLDVAGNVIADLYYDRQNTGYYLDSASTSRINYGIYDNVYSYGWMQAPYFSDANDNNYYVDPASTSSLNAITSATRARWGFPQSWTNRPSITGDTNYWTGSQGWGANNLNTEVPGWGSTFFDVWSNPVGQPEGTSHWQGLQAFHYWNGATGYGSQLLFGSPMMNGALFMRSIWGGGWSSWTRMYNDNYHPTADTIQGVSPGSFRQFNVWQNNHYSGTDGAEYATIFYDTNNAGYYLDSASTSRINYGIYDNVYSYGWMQAPYFLDANDNGYYVDPNSVSYFNDIRPNVIYDRQDTNYYLDPNGYSRVYAIQPTYSFNGAVYDYNDGGYYLDPASTSRINYGIYDNVYSYGWMQAPYFSDANDNNYYVDPASISYLNDLRVNILYDRQNTGYYVDPASTSNLNAISANTIGTGYLDFRYAGSDSGLGLYAYAIYQEGGAWTYPYPDLRIAYHTGIKLGANPSYGGIRFYNDYDMSTLVMSVNDVGTGGANNVYIPNIAYIGDARARILYDWDNTGYYLDPASTSNLNALSVNSLTGYFQATGGFVVETRTSDPSPQTGRIWLRTDI